jgi:hypothetical protein
MDTDPKHRFVDFSNTPPNGKFRANLMKIRFFIVMLTRGRESKNRIFVTTGVLSGHTNVN